MEPRSRYSDNDPYYTGPRHEPGPDPDDDIPLIREVDATADRAWDEAVEQEERRRHWDEVAETLGV